MSTLASHHLAWLLFLLPVACLTPPSHVHPTGPGLQVNRPKPSPNVEPMADLDAWTAASRMGLAVNIGNTLENTTTWETGWGNPPITRGYIESLRRLGYSTVRLPVAWDTYAENGEIQADKLGRVGEVVDWITQAGMFCVVNVHWDGGWIDSSNKERFGDTFATFSDEAERKYPAYWRQIAQYFAGKGSKLVFEALNEETNFTNEGSTSDAYATLTRVQQLFIDAVRGAGGNNAKRLVIVAGYHTDIEKTCNPRYRLPKDTVPNRMMISVHYYTPWQFCGMTEDADWGKMMATWGSPSDLLQLDQLFDKMAAFSKNHDLPVFLGEYGVVANKDEDSRVRWLSAVTRAATTRKMVPVLWDTGGEISRREPYEASRVLMRVLAEQQTAVPSVD